MSSLGSVHQRQASMDTDNEEDVEASKDSQTKSLLSPDGGTGGALEARDGGGGVGGGRRQVFTQYQVHRIERSDKRGKLSSGWHNLQRLVVFLLAAVVRAGCPRKASTRYERANSVDDEDLHHHHHHHHNHSAPAAAGSTHLLFRCFMPQNFRFVHLLVIVFFFLFFVIQFKPFPTEQSSVVYQQSAQPQKTQDKWIQQHLNSIRDLFDSGWRERALPNVTTPAPAYHLPFGFHGNRTQSNEACPLVPPKLVGSLKVLLDPPPMEKMEELLAEVELGGRYRPHQCRAKDKVAIIVPYRDRAEHLKTFLWNLHPMLMRQNIDYAIYVVEQDGKAPFNRAKLMNIGYLEALKQYPYDCFIFHDIDLLPENDLNLYTCPEQPRHMSVAVDKFRYRLPYADIFGGVSALTKDQFERVNGFSNEFWGWGGEDDDMSNRIRHYKYKITRYPPNIARYKMLKHSQQPTNDDRYKKLYNGWQRYKKDGIRNVHYEVKSLVFKKLYTWVLVNVFPPKTIRVTNINATTSAATSSTSTTERR